MKISTNSQIHQSTLGSSKSISMEEPSLLLPLTHPPIARKLDSSLVVCLWRTLVPTLGLFKYCIIILLYLHLFIVDINCESELDSTLNQRSSGSLVKSKNSDLLTFKMFHEHEDEDESNDPTLTGRSRFQRHAARKERHHRKRNRKLHSTISPLISSTLSPPLLHHPTPYSRSQIVRNSFLALRSSPIDDTPLGRAPPQLLNKRKTAFCKTVPFKQTISDIGCETKTIMNSYCFGACNSFYIPSDGNQTIPFSSCSYCLPRRYRWTTVRLRCPLYNLKNEASNLMNDNDDDDYNVIQTKNLNRMSNINGDGNVVNAADNDNDGDSDSDDDDDDNDDTQSRSQQVFAYRNKKIQIVTKCRCQVGT